METDPEGALSGFAEVVRMEGEKGEWYVEPSTLLIFSVRSFLVC